MKRLLAFLIMMFLVVPVWAWEDVWIDGQAIKGHQIQEEGTAVTQRAYLNFIGADIVAAETSGITTVTVDTTITGDGRYVQLTDRWLEPPVEDWHDFSGGDPSPLAVGDRYISDGTHGDFEDGFIYEWDGAEWVESEPAEGWMVWMLVELLFYVFFSGGWMEEGSESYVPYTGALYDVDLGSQDIETNGDYHIDTVGLTDNAVGASGCTLIGMQTDDTPTYDALCDWSAITQSAGLISGGVISDAGSGNINVTAGCGIAKTADTEISPNVFIDFDARNGIAIAQNSKHTVYVDYDNTPQVLVGVSPVAGLDYTTKFPIGSVFYDGTTMHVLNEAGTRIYNVARRGHYRARKLRGFERATGLVIADEGTRHFSITNGVIFAGWNEISITGMDTTTPTDYISWYYDADAGPAAWISDTTNTQLDNVYYNDPETGVGDALLALTTNRYGVHWIYMDIDNHCNVVYGQGNYTLAGAQDAQPPSSLPPLINNFAILVAKVIVQEGEAEITELSTAYDIVFTAASPSDHGELGGLSDDDHTQYVLNDGEGTNITNGTFDLTTTGTITAQGYTKNIVTKTGAYTLTSADDTVLGNTNAFDLTLPTASGIDGKVYTIKKINTEYDEPLGVDPDGTETIDGDATTYDIYSVNSGITIQSDGTNWVIIGAF